MARIGYAPGVYDLFHVGHLNILRQAKEQCDVLVAGAASDEFCLYIKGRPPVVPLAERLEILGSIRYVDAVVTSALPEGFDPTDPMPYVQVHLNNWRQTPFDLLFKGDDWRGTAKGRSLECAFARLGVEIVYFPYTVHTSSTILRRALDAIEDATSQPLAAQA